MIQPPVPSWFPLLTKPYQNLLGGRNAWDLRMPDGTPVRVERGTQGINNTLFRVRVRDEVFACKLGIEDERHRAEREWAAICAVQAAGSHLAPEPIAFVPAGTLPHPVVVYRWPGGLPLSGQSVTVGELTTLAGALAEVHSLPLSPEAGLVTAWHQPSGYAEYCAEIMQTIGRVRGWATGLSATDSLPAWAAGLTALLPAIEAALDDAGGAQPDAGHCEFSTLVRLDGNLENAMRLDDGRLVFVDWGYSGLGDPAFDLAELRWHPRALQIPPEQWKVALAAYAPASQDRSFAERLAIYQRLVPLWWVGRTILHLLEGSGQLSGRRQPAQMPERMYRAVRRQLDCYLAALGIGAQQAIDDAEE